MLNPGTKASTAPQKPLKTRQILLAKNLLKCPNLSVLDVAYSAGFNSLHRFNDDFKSAAGESPLRHRKKYSQSDTILTKATNVTLKLAFRKPFDWLPLKKALLAHMIPGLENIDYANNTLNRLIKVAEHRLVLISISLDAPEKYITLTAKVAAMSDLNKVAQIVKRVFDLEARPADIKKVLGSDCLIGPLIAQRPGLRICGMFDPFELLINTIIGQQVSVVAARTFSQRLIENYGQKVGDFYVYPTAHVLVTASPAEIYQKTKLNHKKIATIQAVCALIVDGFDLSSIAHDSSARARLLAVKGIGPWTIGYLILRGLGDSDGFPSDDLFIKRLLKAKTARQAEQIAQIWRPYRGYATMQLWTKGTYDE